MYFGPEAFLSQVDDSASRELFRKCVERVELETHSYCNRSCDYCPNSTHTRRGVNQRMAPEIFSKIIDGLAGVDYHSNLILQSYNEPLADRIIIERLVEARRKLPGAKLQIYSNGDYLTSSYLDELAEAGLDYLRVSIHMAPGEPYSDMAALTYMSNLSVRLGKVLMFRQLRPGSLIVATMNHGRLALDVHAENYVRSGTNRGNLVPVVKGPERRTAPCYFPFAHFHIGYTGNVVPCCHIRSDAPEHERYVVGNVAQVPSIYHVFSGRTATAWRRHLISFEPKDDPCRTCSVPFIQLSPQEEARLRNAWQNYVVETTEQFGQ
jgi:MoaA/NifB/PqqE/SkfB family radical SAM enzyme